MKNPALTAPLDRPLRIRNPELFGARRAIERALAKRKGKALSRRQIDRLRTRHGNTL